MDSAPVTNNELQLAVAPIQKSIDRIENDLRNLDDRIARLPDIYLTRADYKDRADLMVADVRQIQIDAAISKQWANDEHTRIRDAFLIETKAIRAEMQTQNRVAAQASSANTKWLIALLCSPVLFSVMTIITDLVLHALHVL